jgi:UDP-glucose 4-epimerase
MSEPRLLVTGGAGFIGSHVCDHALARGWKVAVLDNLSSGRRENVPEGAEFFEVDLRAAAATKTAVETFSPNLVSHQAAQASVAVSMRDPQLDADNNVMGGLNLWAACVAAGVEHIVFASTGGAIYGEVEPGRRAKAGDRELPVSPYAISKLAVEQYYRALAAEAKIKVSVLRYANVYGPRQDPHGEAGVVAIFCNRLIARQPLQINAMNEAGDDGCVRDYVYVEDVARANLLALDGKLDADILDIGTGEETNTAQLLEGLAKVLDPERETEVRRTPRRVGDLLRSVLDADAFRAVLGEPVPLEEGLRRTAEAFQAAAS